MKCRCLLLFSCLFVLFSFSAFAEAFLPGTEDVPLMPYFTISGDDTFSLDGENGQGQLFFSKALSKNKASDIYQFYDQTLPQLGWKKVKLYTFEREGDLLTISVSPEKDGLNGVFFELIIK